MNAPDRFNAPPGAALQQAARPVRIIGAASGLGGGHPSCADGPTQLRLAGIDAHLAARGLAVEWGDILFADPAHGEPVAQVVDRLCERLARTVAEALRAGILTPHFPTPALWRKTAAEIAGAGI